MEETALQGTPLVLDSVIGFGGTVPKGLQYHPNERHILFPLGSTVVIRDTQSREQDFLQGHRGRVSTIAISSSGRYVASGEETHMGFQAAIIIWDFETRQQIHKLMLHKGKVQGLAFSPSEQLLASIGGVDDNAAVVWDVQTGRAICGAPATHEAVNTISFFHSSDTMFVTAGQSHLRVWEIDLQNRKIRPNDCQLGHYRRVILCAVLDRHDEYLYCGTTTGDVLAVNVRTKLFKQVGPAKEKERFEQGVTAIDILGNGEDLVLGAGNGKVALMHIGDLATAQCLRIVGSTNVMGAVTSLHLRPSPLPDPLLQPATPPPRAVAPVKPSSVNSPAPPIPLATHQRAFVPRQKEPVLPPQRHGPTPSTPHTRALVPPRPVLQECLCGTAQSNMYTITVPTMVAELRATCHPSPITSVAFPMGFSELFATSSFGDIRVWNARTCTELLRIQVPNVACNIVCFNPRGTEIISGWSDGKIRGFGPESGRLLYVINDAHKNVTALAVYRSSPHIVSGGSEGQVRVWRLDPSSQTLVSTMKEHRATVTCIRMNNEDTECISASADGSCVIWDLTRFRRRNTLLASTVFKSVSYSPDNSQMLTCGTDRKVCYWDNFDASTIRELEASNLELAALSIDQTSLYFVTGGTDKLLKLWHYDEGVVRATGVGHSGAITSIAYSPDNQHIVSVGNEGAILIWKNIFHTPEEAAPESAPSAPAPAPAPAPSSAKPSATGRPARR